MARSNNLLSKVGKETKRRTKTRQGNGRGTKVRTRMKSTRFKQTTRGPGQQ